jgi:hypothetical protein
MKKLLFALCGVALCFVVGCGDSQTSDGHSHADGHGHSHDDHAPPHGGTPVIVAEDKFHLELVHDAAAGRMQAYVLNGHLEGYVQVPETNFVIEPDSSNVPAKSSLFEAHSDWLKSAKEFEGNIPTITLDGKTFTNISFSFPKGSKHVH